METTIEYAGYKWSRKPSGYYQSTTRCTDGSRKNWLHQYVYEEDNGPIPQGYDVHHRNENKSDNSISNLELLTMAEHQEEHLEQNRQNGFRLSKYVEEHFDEVQGLAKLGKKGLYTGRAKRKKLARGHIDCGYCGESFIPHNKARTDTKYCSTTCRDAGNRAAKEPTKCSDCGELFEAVSKHAKKCPECRTASRSKAINVLYWKVCKECENSFEGVIRQTYCGKECARAGENRAARERRKNS
ncbi:MAG: HNH endonuclease [Prevotella sp.]